MMDKNGKIGGKVNIIDLIVVIVLVAVLAFAGYRLLTRDGSDDAQERQVYLSMTGAEVSNYVVEQLKIGAPVLDDTEHKSLGNVTDIQTGPAYRYEANKEGNTVVVNAEDSSSVTITCLATGTLDGNGMVIGRARYAIGHTFVVYVGDCKLYLRISGLEAA